ncbi:hypothetical protein PISMIDRAFT_61391, partial [Pisolithus microcarpus 441]
DNQIWKSQKKPWIPKKIQDYLWKITHNVLKVGNFFKNIPSLEHLQNCPHCKLLETPKHILLKCKENKAPFLWAKITKLLRRTDEETEWLIPTIEMIQSPNLIKLHCNQGDNLTKDKEKLYQILITEAIWLLWKTRNTRIFEN